MIVHADSAPACLRTLTATVCWLDETPLDRNRKYALRHTTREVRARVERIAHLWNVGTQTRESAPPTLQMNDIGEIELALAQPVFADAYGANRATGSFILVDESSNNTVAAGLIA
jgi:sulfate adenylyltransferase subunit 1